MRNPAPLAAIGAALLAAPLAAQFTEIPQMNPATTAFIDMDNVGPAGPTTVTAINAAGTPFPANISNITLQPSGAAAGVYNTNPQLGRALALDTAAVGLELIDPPSGAFTAFNATIDFAGPSTEFGFEVGDWNGPMVLDFKSAGTSVGQITSSGFNGTGEKYFRAPCGTFFDSVDITASTAAGNWVITSLAIQVASGGPIADFSGTPTSGAAPLSVTFTDSSCAPAGVALYQWDFDNDRNIDSTQANPSFTYNTAGNFSVTLTITDATNATSSVTKTDYITVVGPTNNTESAEILEYQFNEVRGDTVANTASTNLAPLTGQVTNTGWHADTGRVPYQGNEPGFGALGQTANTNENLVNTGYALDLTDMTVMWWHRPQASAGTSLSYAFGGSGASVRCFTGGVAGNTLWYRGTPIGDVQAAGDVQSNLGAWQHIALSIDDTAGTATWYIDGLVDSITNFTPGTHVAQNTEFHVAYHTSTTSTYSRFYDMDDFRLYNRALNQTDVQNAMMGENPTTSTFGPGCAGTSGVPTIGASGGAPAINNTTFAIDYANVEPNRPTTLSLGFIASAGGTLPLDVSFLLGAGCGIEQSADLGVGLTTATGSGSFPLAVPNDASLVGGHLYAQVIVLGSGFPVSGNGAVSPALDINVQN